jgi:hypothetical protein
MFRDDFASDRSIAARLLRQDRERIAMLETELSTVRVALEEADHRARMARERASLSEMDVERLLALLADAERVIMEHHSGAIHRAPPGTICQVCAEEHEAVQAIWKELHET